MGGRDVGPRAPDAMRRKSCAAALIPRATAGGERQHQGEDSGETADSLIHGCVLLDLFLELVATRHGPIH